MSHNGSLPGLVLSLPGLFLAHQGPGLKAVDIWALKADVLGQVDCGTMGLGVLGLVGSIGHVVEYGGSMPEPNDLASPARLWVLG